MITNPKPTPSFTSWRRIFCSLVLVAAAVALVASFASSDAVGQRVELPSQKAFHPAPAQKIAPWVMEHTANGQHAEFFVLLADQADLSPAANLPTKTEKGRFVYQTLLEKAQSTQGPILQLLRDRNIENQSFYIVNAILVKGDRQLAEMLAARPDVAHVTGNPIIHNDLPQRGPVDHSPLQPRVPLLRRRSSRGLLIRTRLTCGRSDSRARLLLLPELIPGFAGLITRSSRITAAGTEQTRNHNFNWHDSIHDSVGNPCGNDSPEPCDDFFHGSHTIGTAIGDDGGTNQIGMAPGAKWIGCRNMDQGDGTPARYIECMEFFLAPYPLGCTPNEGDPAMAPDITTNSWGCPASEGCIVGDELQAAVEAQEAAGIQMVVAAGNSGPGCSTVSDPPSFYAASYTVGALNTGTDTIAGFSSRGPVTRDGSNRTKPDITAPGTNTRSCDNTCDSCYTTASGTSMATPHIAGAMALLWSAIPSLQHQIQAKSRRLE